MWFDYWDVNKDGHLSPEELIPALTAAYEVGDLGRQWIESYVNTHYRPLVLQDGCGSQSCWRAYFGEHPIKKKTK